MIKLQVAIRDNDITTVEKVFKENGININAVIYVSIKININIRNNFTCYNCLLLIIISYLCFTIECCYCLYCVILIGYTE